MMVLRGSRNSCPLSCSGLLDKGNKIGDLLTSLLVVLMCLGVFEVSPPPTYPEVTLWEGMGVGSCLFPLWSL